MPPTSHGVFEDTLRKTRTFLISEGFADRHRLLLYFLQYGPLE